jgi:cytochrome oxidase Cu insertion factor (SCO1/SenC/PrrC family)
MGRPGLALTAAVLVACAALFAPAGASVSGKVDDLLWDLHIIPLEPATPPPLASRDLAGAAVSLSQFKGRPVVLYFWATW